MGNIVGIAIIPKLSHYAIKMAFIIERIFTIAGHALIIFVAERTDVVNNTASLSNDDQKQALEKSHNIYLPESAFNVLLANQCEFPLLFTVSNYEDNTQITHVGAQEFSSNDGIAIIPNTLMKRLSYPTTIRVKYTQLPPAQNIEFQPHNSSFLKQQNNQMYIRNTLSHLSCISIDDTINVKS